MVCTCTWELGRRGDGGTRVSRPPWWMSKFIFGKTRRTYKLNMFSVCTVWDTLEKCFEGEVSKLGRKVGTRLALQELIWHKGSPAGRVPFKWIMSKVTLPVRLNTGPGATGKTPSQIVTNHQSITIGTWWGKKIQNSRRTNRKLPSIVQSKQHDVQTEAQYPATK